MGFPFVFFFLLQASNLRVDMVKLLFMDELLVPRLSNYEEGGCKTLALVLLAIAKPVHTSLKSVQLSNYEY